MSSDSISLGSQWVITRRLDADTIRHFAEITGDTGAHHIGQRGIAHGLLVAAVPTEIGGRLSFLGREMRLVFHRPVPAGTTVSAAVTVSHLGPVRRGWSISLSAEVTDSERNLVLTADADGR